ncbi:hypothetical protein AGLY_008012 [Aphis glycines]|uniref:Uncharacterized protein n=1 Tax=Aphis glycines TaxID=307491 RepID=A0A6G0TMI3_APHGL|nr:hypothetical protein AGLY_008012 [Aphis glycines]
MLGINELKLSELDSDSNISGTSTIDVMEVTPSYSFCKDAVAPLFYNEECDGFSMIVNKFDGNSNVPSPSIVDVMETFIDVSTPTKMSNNFDISGPLNTDVMETSNLDIQVPITPKIMMNTTKKSTERKSVFGDFKADDLNTPRKRKRYRDISQQTVSNYKCRVKLLYNKNMWLNNKVKHLCQLIDHLKDESKISDNCFSVLKSSKVYRRSTLLSCFFINAKSRSHGKNECPLCGKKT